MRYSIAVVLLFPLLSLAQNLSFREIQTREGVKQKFVYQKAVDPIASAVLFQGGPGPLVLLDLRKKVGYGMTDFFWLAAQVDLPKTVFLQRL